jgi:hypothetical protein
VLVRGAPRALALNGPFKVAAMAASRETHGITANSRFEPDRPRRAAVRTHGWNARNFIGAGMKTVDYSRLSRKRQLGRSIAWPDLA